MNTNLLQSRAKRLLEVCEAKTGTLLRGYINLDNAATTPAARQVWAAVESAVTVYGSVHRGSGLKSIISTQLFERAKERVLRFVGARPGDVIAIASNSTAAINRFANSFDFRPNDIVLVSEMEHSSNDLPWRKHATIRVASNRSGAMDLDDLETTLKRGKVRLVAVTGASNVNGALTPIRDVARLVHRYGAELFVDAAQLAAHRQIIMQTGKPEEDIDYVAFSGHKMYAPFGAGVVIGHHHAFSRLPPDLPGGGTVEMLTADDQIWASLPERLNSGSPNLIGMIAIAAAAETIEGIGFDRIRKHEANLVKIGLQVLGSLPSVRLYGQSMFSPNDDRLPIFPFTIDDIPFGKVAAILGHEHQIAVRQGHLCQYEFMRRELGVSVSEQQRIKDDLSNGDKSSRYGMVRASGGLCTAENDLYALAKAISAIVDGDISLEYRQDPGTGEYRPVSHSAFDVDCIPAGLKFLFKTTNEQNH